MDDRIAQLRETILQGVHKKRRISTDADPDALARDYAAQEFSPEERAVRRFVFLLRQQEAVLLPGQRIVGMRTTPLFPELFTQEERQLQGTPGHPPRMHLVTNVLPPYAQLLENGCAGIRNAITLRLTRRCTREQVEYLEGLLECIDAVMAYCGSYALRAEMQGDRVLADTLRFSMENGASSLREALQILRIAHFMQWCAGQQNVPIGRLDQLLMPYYWADKERGMRKEEAISLVSEFYLSLLLDQDTYPAGGNAQPITLGGVDASGNGALNEMTLIAMLAALDVQLPQLEIRLRASTYTPHSLLEMAAQLRGTGPLYVANDDIIIPGLVEQGYSMEDARQYAIGAGGTILVPGALDIPCVGAIDLYDLTHTLCAQYIERCHSIGMLLSVFTKELKLQCEAIMQAAHGIHFEPAPILSLAFPGCIENARDFSLGGTYNNYGIAVQGAPAAADVLHIVQTQVFGEAGTPAADIAAALQGTQDAHTTLTGLFPHVICAGNNDDAADAMLRLIAMGVLDCLHNRRNEHTGLFIPGAAPGTHTALPGARSGAAPLIRSYTKLDMKKLLHAGPLLLPLPAGAQPREAAQIMELFIKCGGNTLKTIAR